MTPAVFENWLAKYMVGNLAGQQRVREYRSAYEEKLLVAKKVVDVVKVENHGDKLILPQGLTTKRAIEVLRAKMEYEEQVVAINAPIDAFVPDAAHALYRVLEDKFGWVNAVATPTIFGPRPPEVISVSIGIGKHVQVPWGRFVVPGIEDGFLHTGTTFKDGRYIFQIGGQVKRKYEPAVSEIVEAVKTYLRSYSIFKGKAFSLRLKDDGGDMLPMPEPKWLDLNPALEHTLIFNDDVMANIDISIFTFIEQTKQVRDSRIPLKRGVLLSGRFGTGKSLTSTVTAIKATRNGWTYIIADRADELAEVLRLAREYGPAVVFCEDIDRVMSGQRNVDMDQILNIVDGVESKNSDLMVVLTTNAVEHINQAMLRPGRLDAVIHVSEPDAKSVQRLIRLYGHTMIDPDTDLSKAADMMKGRIAAAVEEMVKRAKLAAIRSNPDAEISELTMSEDDLIKAAASMQNQLRMLEEHRIEAPSEIVKAARVLRFGTTEPTPEQLAAAGGALLLEASASPTDSVSPATGV